MGRHDFFFEIENRKNRPKCRKTDQKQTKNFKKSVNRPKSVKTDRLSITVGPSLAGVQKNVTSLRSLKVIKVCKTGQMKWAKLELLALNLF